MKYQELFPNFKDFPDMEDTRRVYNCSSYAEVLCPNRTGLYLAIPTIPNVPCCSEACRFNILKDQEEFGQTSVFTEVMVESENIGPSDQGNLIEDVEAQRPDVSGGGGVLSESAT